METELKPGQISKIPSRRDRRLSQRMAKGVENLGASLPGVTSLTSFDRVLDQEDNLKFLEREGGKYRSALSIDITAFRLLVVLSSSGFSEEYQRNTFRDIFADPRSELTLSELTVMDTVNKLQALDSKKLIWNLLSVVRRTPVVYRDEDDEAILAMLDEGTDIAIKDLMSEKIRSQQERVDLLNMQTALLKARARAVKRVRLKEERNPKKKVSETLAEFDTVEKEPLEEDQHPVANAKIEDLFTLKDWQVFWTTRYWSRDPSHLVPIPTDSRNLALDELQKLSRGKISINPSSVLDALAFHLRRDTIQRALASRLKYVPEHMREWVKIKRGDDRILVLLPVDDPNKLIFFAGSRDVIYRNFSGNSG